MEHGRAATAKATIIDVARSAGVSPATVSRVLTGAKAVSVDLERRVRDAVEQLGYRPNPAAQGLLRGTTHAVGVVVPDLGNPYFAEVLKGVTAAAAAADFRTLVTDTDEQPGAEFEAARELARWADGVVLCAPRMSDADLTQLAGVVSQLVCVNRIEATQAIRSVSVDFAAGITLLCEHLKSLGHQRIVYLRGPGHAWSERERERALGQAARAGMDIVQVPCGAHRQDGYAAADQALAIGGTAIIAFSDYVALGVLARLRELGVSVPGEMSLAGFDNISFAGLVAPSLTTVAVDTQDLGRQGWSLLFGERSRDPRRGGVSVHPEIIVRASTAPPAA
ncbi:MAG TPA: LacI family DNA-binding transcriptional regulator [Pseudonocardiaceae bacterium]|nr:LacI family DNA-binding transcriptional regulator [Pseudonocardiaceae bacterium]